jgi:hypothetical protein
MGPIELLVVGSMLTLIFWWALGGTKKSADKAQLVSEGGDEPPRKLGETLKAALGRVGPGQLPIGALPLRHSAIEEIEDADELELGLTLEEDAAPEQWEDEAHVCRITLREPGGGVWAMELVGGSAAWSMRPADGEAAAIFRAKGRIKGPGQRRWAAAVAAHLELSAPPELEGEADSDGEFEVRHFGLVEDAQGVRWEVLQLHLSVGAIYPLWLKLDRRSGAARLIANKDEEERPMAVIGMELATRGQTLPSTIYDVPAIAARTPLVKELKRVADAEELEGVDLEGKCVATQAGELLVASHSGPHLEIKRWRELTGSAEVLLQVEISELEEVCWSACGARVAYLATGDDGVERQGLFDVASGTHTAVLFEHEPEGKTFWERRVSDRWPLASVSFTDDETDAQELSVLDLRGERVWSMEIPEEVESLEHCWTERGMYVCWDDEATKRHWLWEPELRRAREISGREEAGPGDGHAALMVREGYGVRFAETQARWEASCIDELDALYFWFEDDHIWAGRQVMMEDACWSVVDIDSGLTSPLCDEEQLEEVEAMVAGCARWVVLTHGELGLVYGELEGAASASWGGGGW